MYHKQNVLKKNYGRTKTYLTTKYKYRKHENILTKKKTNYISLYEGTNKENDDRINLN